MSLIDKVKDLFKTSEPEKFEDVKDQNGNIIRIDQFKEGGTVSLMSSDGTLIPLEPGDYVLEDGRKFSVAEKGVIGTITGSTPDDTTAKDTQTPAEVVQPIANDSATGTTTAEAETSMPIDKVGQRLDSLEAQVMELMSAFEELMNQMKIKNEAFTKLEVEKKDLEKEIKEHKKQIKELEKSPAGDPVKIQMENVTGTNEPDYGKMFTELKKFKKIK